MKEKIMNVSLDTLESVQDFILSMADDALNFRGLTAGDRAAIEHGIAQLNEGLAFLMSDDPVIVRQVAARLLMLAAFRIGERCAVSDSEEDYWRRRRSAKGGKGEKEKRRANRKVIERWQEHARSVEAASPKESFASLARGLLTDKLRPVGTPSNIRTLERFLTIARKERIAGISKPIRLVHSA